ncbi:MAG: hypothetical protein KJ902_06050 [Candidatus Omnitrophica bacterium]|nr:hypothetical protein [Candidatus Omnitrophota bacterium]MBU4458285.1 hypothetical protein [Candidatus Omnitrophota bacterium]
MIKKILFLISIFFVVTANVYGGSVSVNIDNDLDDGHLVWNSGSCNFYTGWNYHNAGSIYLYGNGLGFVQFFRFDGVAVPQGATISSATLTIESYGLTGSSTPELRIYGCDEDDSARMTAHANYTAKPRTTAYVTWDTTRYFGQSNISPDIKTIIQEIVDRGGWSSGNAIQLLVQDRDFWQVYSVPASTEEANNIHFCKEYNQSGTHTLSITFYEDIGLRVYNGSQVVSIGAEILDGHKLRIRKGDTTCGLPLVDIDAPNASPIRIYDGGSVKALVEIK